MADAPLFAAELARLHPGAGFVHMLNVERDEHAFVQVSEDQVFPPPGSTVIYPAAKDLSVARSEAIEQLVADWSAEPYRLVLNNREPERP